MHDGGCRAFILIRAQINERRKKIALVRSLKDSFEHFATAFSQTPKDLEKAVLELEDLNLLVRLIISQVPFAYMDKQAVLEESLWKKGQTSDIDFGTRSTYFYL